MWLIWGSATHSGTSQHFLGQHSGELDPSSFSNPLEFVSSHIHAIAFIWRFCLLVYCNVEISCVFLRN